MSRATPKSGTKRPARRPARKAVPRNRLRRAAFVVFATLFSLALGSPAAVAAPANYEGIAADGSVAFFTTADKLVPGDTDSRRDVYMRSFDSGVGSYVTREVSTGPTGGNDAFDAFFERASADGTKAFFSTDERLASADTDQATDAYVRDLAKGTTVLVTQGEGACAPACGNGATPAGFAGASADGAEAFFVTDERLVAADTDSAVDVYVRDLGAETTTLVSAGGSSCAPGCGNGQLNATLRGLSGDGSTAFFATFEPLAAADADTALDIYARALPGGPTTLVSQGDPACSPCGNSNASDAVFAGSSQDGARAFFETDEGLVPGDVDGGNDVYQRAGGATTQVSDGTQSEKPANFAAASTTGARVFFVTAESLVGGDTNGASDVYQWQGASPSLVTSGECCDSTFGTATPDGTKVAFTTTEQLTGADIDSSADVYEQEVSGGAATLVSHGAASCAPACGNGSAAAIFNGSATDASRVFFSSTEALAPEDGDERTDIYSYDLGGSTTTMISFEGVFCPTPGGCEAIFNAASGDGGHVFFQTTERLTEGDGDSEIDVYERAGGQTRLVSAGNSVELGPSTPVLTGTNPASPGASTTPAIVGQADPNTSIKLYTTSDCSGAVVATGTATQLGGGGVAVTVAAGSTTTFRVTATDENGDTSPCSNGVSYTQESAPPPPPPPLPPDPGSGSGSGGGSGGGKAGVVYVTPHTRITFAPAGKTRARRPVFRFTDSTGQEGTSFRCKVDRRGWRGCGSPTRLKRLSAGRHVFQVKAVNALGETEPASQKRRFKVVAR